jgi:hypothetical protein
MVESTREFVGSRLFNTILSAVGAFGGAGAFLAVIMGWVTVGNTNAYAIQSLQGQMAALSAQLERVTTKIEQGPQSIQMKEFDRHLSAIDGRMDGMDTRVSSDERALTKVQADVENIRSSSDAQLRGHPR